MAPLSGKLCSMNRSPTRTLFRFLPVALLSLFGLNSCLTVGVNGTQRKTTTRFNESTGAEAGHGRNAHRNNSPTRKELVAEWGEPENKQTTADGGENWIWRPRHESIWSGLWAIVGIVPVPLVLPLSAERTEVRFGPGNGPALEKTHRWQHETYAGIGIAPDETGRAQHGPFFWYDDAGQQEPPDSYTGNVKSQSY
jgi:hypothetical protein